MNQSQGTIKHGVQSYNCGSKPEFLVNGLLSEGASELRSMIGSALFGSAAWTKFTVNLSSSYTEKGGYCSMQDQLFN
jgi:hypothetical protein